MSFMARLSDSAMCWPSLTVQVHVPPWHWRFVPYFYLDSTHGHTRPDGSEQAGWWGISTAWLMIEVDLGWNRPPFTWETS